MCICILLCVLKIPPLYHTLLLDFFWLKFFPCFICSVIFLNKSINQKTVTIWGLNLNWNSNLKLILTSIFLSQSIKEGKTKIIRYQIPLWVNMSKISSEFFFTISIRKVSRFFSWIFCLQWKSYFVIFFLPAGVARGRSILCFFPGWGRVHLKLIMIIWVSFRFLWVSLGSFGFLWVPWDSLGFLGIPWGSFRFLGVPQSSLVGFLWVSWGSLGFLKVPWGFLGFLGVP